MDTRTEYAFGNMMKQIYRMVDIQIPADAAPSDACRLNTPRAFQTGLRIPLAKEGGLSEDEIMKILGWPI
ncbi:MAG: hypothetical protein HZA50_00385 [Planctomycetes bacterium]|nr:hypothetical protein [Planctomycetota bacterium]